MATFIYETSSHLACSRQAARRQDGRTLRAAVLALGDLSARAGADRMAALCNGLCDVLRAHAIATLPSPIEPLIDAIADEFEQVAGDLHVSSSA